MFSKFKNQATLQAFAKTALFTALCFAGSYYAWIHSDLPRKTHGEYMDGITEAYHGGEFHDIEWGPLAINVKTLQKKTFPAEGIQEIQTDLETINLKVKTDPTEDVVTVTWFGKKKDKPENLSITGDNGVLRIAVLDKKLLRNMKNYGETGIEVKLPLSLVCNSKAPTTKEISDKKQTYSYTLSLKNCGKLRLMAKSTKGEIRLGGTAFKGARIETISGDVRLETVQNHATAIRTVSGNVIMNLVGTAEIETVSGDIGITGISNEALLKATIKTVSGDTDIEFFENIDPNITINFETHSGDAQWNDEDEVSDGLKKVIGKGEGHLDIQGISGDLKVRTKQYDFSK
jgi:hypothetical protein